MEEPVASHGTSSQRPITHPTTKEEQQDSVTMIMSPGGSSSGAVASQAETSLSATSLPVPISSSNSGTETTPIATLVDVSSDQEPRHPVQQV